MLTIKRATRPSRARDRKRKRLLLTIGTHSYHLTDQEEVQLRRWVRREARAGRCC